MRHVVEAALLPILGCGPSAVAAPALSWPSRCAVLVEGHRQTVQPCSKTGLLPVPLQADHWPAHEAWQTSPPSRVVQMVPC